MTLVMLAFEYMMWTALLETVKGQSERIETEQNNKIMNNWKPLSNIELDSIKKLTN